MKTKIITILAAVMFLPVSQVQAIDVDFYSDATIQDGDLYDMVRLYDTPPDQTTVDMTGGSVHNLWSYDSSIINITGGEIRTLITFNTSTANISGVSIYGVTAWDYTTVNLSVTSNVTSLTAHVSGTINMMGGTAEYLGAIDSGTVNLYGGLVTDSLSVGDFAQGNIYGYDLVKTSSGGRYGYGQVYGFWTDSTAFTIDLNGLETYSHINLIPEPNTLVLLAIGCLLMKRKK
ncbi:MAG: PEP-CTERM sorting domain-containing protein [Planctomycetota bacterium]